jgi:hypothetical protein
MIRPVPQPSLNNGMPPVSFSLSLLRIATIGQPEPAQAAELEEMLDRELVRK